ncbi:hypothetical protein D9M68_254340 [compost metagenome]
MNDRHDIVWGWIRNGYIPSQKYGKHMMNGGNILTLQQVLGHASLNMTMTRTSRRIICQMC